MCADAGFHADQARRYIGEPRFHLATRPLLPQHDGAARIVGLPRGTSSCRYRCRSRRSPYWVSETWRAPCLWRPLPASLAGGAGARPDHPISRLGSGAPGSGQIKPIRFSSLDASIQTELLIKKGLARSSDAAGYSQKNRARAQGGWPASAPPGAEGESRLPAPAPILFRTGNLLKSARRLPLWIAAYAFRVRAVDTKIASGLGAPPLSTSSFGG